MTTNKDMVIYTDQNQSIKLNVIINNETLWATQKQMAELFEVDSDTISYHLKNIYNSGELVKNSTTEKISVVQSEGKREVKRSLIFYNLDAIIAVGYRVNSKKATKFRIWATEILKEFIIKGFVLDDERLKQSKNFSKDYFDELLERVRSIRASERRIYQKITDIFRECSIDYDKDSNITRDFYATVQNKFHYAITGETAAEIIYNRADKNSPNMGLTTWKNSPNGRILKSDTHIAKNYLSQKEIKKLERTVSSYFDYIENQIELRKEEDNPFSMAELSKSIDKFLTFNDFKVLDAKGKISNKMAIKKADTQYKEFNKTQNIKSDFDEFIKEIKAKV
jgi:hypothetical protein